MVERRRADVWDVLEDVIKEHPVLLNRAPTLHRLGIQAFEPLLVEGKAIQIHPLVCAAFNADFDGDQMAVHLPLSSEAQAEARVLMLSANNLLSPADGRPMTVPNLDMLIGSYYLTEATGLDSDDGAEVPVFRHLHQIEQALDLGHLKLHQPIEWRIAQLSDGNGSYTPTTPGRALFNATLPGRLRVRETGPCARATWAASCAPCPTTTPRARLPSASTTSRTSATSTPAARA